VLALLLISDGRQHYLDQALRSIEVNFPQFDEVVHIDDSAHELGFGGAIQAGWDRALATGADHVFHVEQDFIFNAPIPLDEMVALLEREPHLAQIQLKRQPWNAAERAAGGIVETRPDDFVERRDGFAVWTEHRAWWTTNPSVYSTAVCELGWPQVPQSEGVFTHQLLNAAADLQFALWGGKFDPPLVTHIGQERAGLGY
jgi:hypothetical protein